MNNLYKNVSLSNSHLFYVDQSHNFYNESITFLCVIQGCANIKYQDFSGQMNQGDLILMKDTGKIQIQCVEKSLFLMVHFDYIFFRDSFQDDFFNLECNSILYKKKSYPTILSLLVKLAIAQTTDHMDNRFLIQHQIYELFHLLKAECLITPLDAPSGKSTRQTAKLQQFTSYLKDNYMSQITLQDAADYMNYTPQYLSNFIKKQLGTTFNGYLNQLRLEAAVNYLKHRDISPEQISFMCGFANPASFHKIFQKEYQTTPEQFKEAYKSSFSNSFRDVSLFTEPSFIRDYLTSSIQANTLAAPSIIENLKQETVFCNINDVAPLKPVWKKLINLGSATNFQSPAFRNHLRMMQTELTFSYGRVTNILSLAQTYYTEGRKYSFNFARAFEVLDFMLSIHIRPFLDLGDKSPTIYLPDGSTTFGDYDTMDPIYRDMMPSFLSSCINRYGYDEVSTWCFELWMRYKNSAMTEMESPLEYFDRFSNLYKSLKSILPDALLGAPGFNTYASLDVLDDTLALLADQKIFPDFISAYIFPYQSSQENLPDGRPKIQLFENPDYFSECLKQLKAICEKNHMGHLPLYITEFSTHIGMYNHFNDSVYQALFILKQYLCNWKNADAMGYFTASDASTEYPVNNMFLFGGNGIICKHGIKKPGYHAFGFLSMLGNEVISQGANHILTHSYDDHYQLIIYNYAHFTSDYCRHSDRYEITKYPEAAFEEKLPYELTLHIQGLAEGRYKIGHHMLSSDHGSVFHEWSRLNYTMGLNDFELNHFKNICVPDMTITQQHVKGPLTITEKLYKNEVCFITIDKLIQEV